MDKSESEVFEQKVSQTLLDSALDAFIVIDGDSKIIFWNAACEIMFGHTKEMAIGTCIHELIVPFESRDKARKAFTTFQQTGTGALVNNVVEIEALHQRGHSFPVEISLSATLIEDKWFSQAIIRSIDRRKKVEAEMKRLATTDPLTGLYNRESMFIHGERELSRAVRYGHGLSLILINIDKLKQINEQAGHIAGDKVIMSLTEFLTEHSRKSDIIGRLSSKEFLLILPETDESMAFMVAEKWRMSIEELEVGNNDINFRCSIGVTGRAGEGNFDRLLTKLEINLKSAKAFGGNKVISDTEI